MIRNESRDSATWTRQSPPQTAGHVTAQSLPTRLTEEHTPRVQKSVNMRGSAQSLPTRTPHLQTPDSTIMRSSAQCTTMRSSAQSLPGRRQQRRGSHVVHPPPRLSQSSSSLMRRKRETRHTMTSAPTTLTVPHHPNLVTPTVPNDPGLEAVKEAPVLETGRYLAKDIPKIELFRRLSKLIQLFTSLCLLSHQNEKTKKDLTKHTVFTDFLKEEEEEKEALKSDLYFDFSYFKANRNMYVSVETKQILSSPPNGRTPQQIAKVKFWLSNIRSFSEYPRRMQQKLIQVGWYEGHPAKKVIIRQGHRPQAFYFLLCGSAVVTVMDTKTQISRTVHFLKRGDSFGELAILHDTVRQSTIINREFSEFLVISREDFVDIFMASGGVKNITDPDHSQFIRNINFLKDWPIDQLALNPKSCLFHFFRRGAVLVKDSKRSDWIYIVKSGSCRILKKLRKVESRLTEHQTRVVGFERVSSQVGQTADQVNKLRLTIAALMAFKNPDQLVSMNENNTQREPDAIDEVAKAQMSQRRRSNDIKTGKSENENRKASLNKRQSVGLPVITKTSTSQGKSWSKLRSVIKNDGRRIPKSKKDLVTEEEQQLPSNTLSFLDDGESRQKEPEAEIEDNFEPVFVEVANLTKGDTFGINFMIFENQPSVSLVSNGAECIVISKKLFLSHCTEAMKRRLLLQEQPYPDDETLQKNLQDKINWQTFKTKTLQTTIEDIAVPSRSQSLANSEQ